MSGRHPPESSERAPEAEQKHKTGRKEVNTVWKRDGGRGTRHEGSTWHTGHIQKY